VIAGFLTIAKVAGDPDIDLDGHGDTPRLVFHQPQDGKRKIYF